MYNPVVSLCANCTHHASVHSYDGCLSGGCDCKTFATNDHEAEIDRLRKRLNSMTKEQKYGVAF